MSNSAALWIVVCQAPLSKELSWQEYWSRLSFPPPGDLPNLGIEPAFLGSPAWQEDSLLLYYWGSPIFISQGINPNSIFTY